MCEFRWDHALGKELTGKATAIVVASSAQVRLTINNEMHAAIYLFPGLKATTGLSPASAVIVVSDAMFDDSDVNLRTSDCTKMLGFQRLRGMYNKRR